jgi:hypothetical protein
MNTVNNKGLRHVAIAAVVAVGMWIGRRGPGQR